VTGQPVRSRTEPARARVLPPTKEVRPTGGIRSEGELKLSDGRTLAYAEWGDLEGRPLLFLHGVPGSRMWIDEDVTRSLHVRLITVDRPGYGRSDLHRGGSLLSWAEDTGALADHLHLPRLAVVAWSMGGPFGLACGAHLGPRVHRLGLLSISHAPIEEEPGGYEALSEEERADVDLAERDPERLVARWELEMDGWQDIVRDPLSVLSSLEGVDAWVMKDVALRKALEAHLREGVRAGPLGMLWEEVMVARPWGFALKDVEVPVRLWHGELDAVPVDRAELIADRVPLAQLTLWPGEGHCGFLRRWDEVLRAMTEDMD
jgi:pimeloyl-ACP methyl ester carboxylesterase